MSNIENKRAKRSQKDYTLGFKLSIVNSVEKGDMTYKQAQATYGIQGRSTVLVWLRKHGKLDWTGSNQRRRCPMSNHKPTIETPAQQIKRLERELADERDRNLILNTMIDLCDSKYGVNLRKKSVTTVSGNWGKTDK
jgi:transposase